MHFRLTLCLCLLAVFAAADVRAQDRCYEILTYTSPEGRVADLDARFREYTRRVFAKHDIEQVGFWIPVENANNEFIYVLTYRQCAERDASWERFRNDPEWQRAVGITEARGPIVSNVERTMLDLADYSPTVGPWMLEQPRAFELRIYTANTGKFEDLMTRFRDHTLRIFEKHGMTNIGYWVPIDNTENQLVFILGYPSVQARAEAWAAFQADPEWRAVAEASEQDGRLVGNVVSIMMHPTEYSPIR